MQNSDFEMTSKKAWRECKKLIKQHRLDYAIDVANNVNQMKFS